MQIVRVVMGKVPTIIVKGRQERVCRARRPRSGNLVVGLAYLGGYNLRHARAREFGRSSLTRLTPFQMFLKNLEQRFTRDLRRVQAKRKKTQRRA